jgi:hypothetical protein
VPVSRRPARHVTCFVHAMVEPIDRATLPGDRGATARARVTPAVDAVALRGAIGNRAFGSLMRRRDLTRQVSSKPRRAAPPQTGAGDGLPPLGTWDELEAALADNTVDVKAIVDRLPERRLNGLGRVEDGHVYSPPRPPLRRRLAAAMSAERFAYLAAAIILESRHAPAARKEALRLLSAMLHDKETALRMMVRPVTVVIVPRDMQATELEEFGELLGEDNGKGAGKTFDGRQFAHVRGVSDVRYGIGVYVAINEENLLGGPPDPKVFEAPKDAKGNVLGSKGDERGGHPVGYSSTTHEVAHVILRQGLTAEQKAVVTKSYNAKRAATTGKDGLLKNLWPDGPRVRPVAPQAWRDVGWTDGTRLEYLAGLTDDKRRAHENYSSQNVDEYFAQLVNAYLGANLGHDATTGQPRNNGRSWVAANEPKEMLDLLDQLFNNATVNDIDSRGALLPGRLANPPYPPAPVPRDAMPGARDAASDPPATAPRKRSNRRRR